MASGTKRTPLGLTAQIAGAAALVIAFTATASAQGASNFLNSADPLFTSVLARPGNLDNTIAYAASAAAQGDIESAISAYEQLRFYNPRLGATRYQLGVLYYQLGSYAQARGYLQTALQMPDVTPELRQKIEDLLDLVDKKLQPDQFSGFAQTGLRYQTNASLGAGSQTVLASGGTLNNNFVAKSDWNWFGTVGLDYVHDFETQTGETFEASNLELRRARPVRCAVYHRAYNRMAGRAWRRSADLAETRIRIAAAISQRDIECSGVLLSRPGDQRRTVDQILRAQ